MYLFACAHEEGICTFLIAFLKVMVGYDYPIILIESPTTQVYLFNLILAMHTPLNAFGMSQKQCQSSSPYQLSKGIFIRAIRSLVILWFSLWKCSILCFSSNFLAKKNYAIFPSLQIYGLTWKKKVQDANKLLLNMVAIKSANYSRFMATWQVVVQPRQLS